MKILLCPLSDPGYLYPTLAVGRRLRELGEDVTVLGRPDARPLVLAAGLEFLAAEQAAGRSGFSVGRWFLDADQQYGNILRAARELRPDVLLTSVLSLGALLAGEVLDLPTVVLGLATHLWNYSNRVEDDYQHSHRQWRTDQLLHRYNSAREQLGLPPRRDRLADTPLTGAGLLLRGDPLLECPGAELPPGVGHVGACNWAPKVDPEELAAVADAVAAQGKPMAYVHLGRTFGGESLWPRLNAAFTSGPMQAVVELGRSGDPQPAAGASVTLVSKPWLAPLVESAALVLTSGTSAPTLAALQAGRPLVMAPAGSEQPILTAACVRAGVAVRLPEDADPILLQSVLDEARGNQSLIRASARLGARLRAAGGAASVAEYVRSVASDGPFRGELAG